MRREAFKIKSFVERAKVTQEAEAILRRCIELDPTEARAYNSLGKHLQLERRFEEAKKVYDDGLAVSGELHPSGQLLVVHEALENTG